MDIKTSRRKVLTLGAITAVAAGVFLGGKPLLRLFQNRSMKNILRAGIITDVHRTTLADIQKRKFSAALPKMREFIQAMNSLKPDFVIELGDLVDLVEPGTDPEAIFHEIDSVFTSFDGPAYHVLGNHDFENLSRDFLLKTIENSGIPQGKTWYSWDMHGIHCIVLDANYIQKDYRPYDPSTPDGVFWNWRDTCIPPQQMEWLANDLKNTSLPTIIFTHQTVDRGDDEEQNIKNASTLRGILEQSGKVLAVISGHDHKGSYAEINGIHYVVLKSNISRTDKKGQSLFPRRSEFNSMPDNQFSLLSIGTTGKGRYLIEITGYGNQPDYYLERIL